MRLYPLNATQEDMLQAANPDTLETGFMVCIYFTISQRYCTYDEMTAACQRVLDEVHYTHVHLVRLDDGQLMISENTDMPNQVHCHQMSRQEWETRQQEFVRPFKLLEEPGVRIDVTEADEHLIVSITFCHIFFDGVSMKGLFNCLETSLAGQSIEDQGDITCIWNEKERASYGTEAYKIAQQATCEKFRGHHYTDICRPTNNPFGRTLYACYLLDYSRMRHIRLNSSALTEEQQKKMMTTISVAAYALALGQMAETTDVVFMTTNHGRIDKRLNMKVLGNFLKSMSLRINTDPEQSVAELIAQTRTALFGMMRTIGYPWTHMVRDLQLSPEEQVGTEMNVSGSGIYEYITIKGADYPGSHIEMPESDMHLFLVVQIREEGLTFNVEGSEALYTQEQLDMMARLTGEYTIRLIGDQNKKLKEIILPHDDLHHQ